MAVFKSINSLYPSYMRDLFNVSCNTGYHLRNAQNKLVLPKPRTDYRKRSTSVTEGPSYGIVFHAHYESLIPSPDLKGALTNTSYYRTHTRQTCKPVLFLLQHFITICFTGLMFLPCKNKVYVCSSCSCLHHRVSVAIASSRFCLVSLALIMNPLPGASISHTRPVSQRMTGLSYI